MTESISPIIKAFFHAPSSTLSYVVACPNSNSCVIIDPALDYDLSSGKLSTDFANELISYIKVNNFTVEWILETHAHADHVTSAQFLKKALGGKIACGEHITRVQQTFKQFFNLANFNANGSQFDHLIKDQEELNVGELTLKALHTPGHTPDSMTYVIGKHAFIGDTLFMPDSGSARCDFPAGSAGMLYDSIQKIYALGDETLLYVCHDYLPDGRQLQYVTSVKSQKMDNIQICQQTNREQYIENRNARDQGLAVPRLIYPSLQFNIRGGKLPDAQGNNQYFVKMPVIGTDILT